MFLPGCKKGGFLMKRIIRCFGILILTVLAFSLLSACGKDSETAEPTPTATAAPTATTTPTATTAPSATPTVDPDDPFATAVVDYDVLTSYLGLTAGEVKDKIGKLSQYQNIGEDYISGTDSAIYFNYEVYFLYDDMIPSDSYSYVTEAILVYNRTNADKAKDFGNGLSSAMTYSQLKSTLGDALLIADSEIVGSSAFVAFCTVGGYRYAFLWDENPEKNDVLPLCTYISKTGLIWVPKLTMLPFAKDYIAENAGLLQDNGTRYIETLRGAYKDVPISMNHLLASLNLDSDNKVELYEIATYGRAPDVSGTKEVECYDYTITARFLVNGVQVTRADLVKKPITTGADDESIYTILGTLYFHGDPASISGADLYNMCDVHKAAESTVISCAELTLQRKKDSEALVKAAYYIGNEAEPVLTRRYIKNPANNEIYDDLIVGPDGTEYRIPENDTYRWGELSSVTGADVDRIHDAFSWVKLELAPDTYILHIIRSSTFTNEAHDFLLAGDCMAFILSESRPR